MTESISFRIAIVCIVCAYLHIIHMAVNPDIVREDRLSKEDIFCIACIVVGAAATAVFILSDL